MNQVKFINVPAYDEIGVKAMYSKVIKMEGMERYFPSKYPKGTQCDKGYLYNVWNSLHPEVVKNVIDHANSQRFAMTAEKVKQESINITEGWQQELDSLPFVSKQKGRMSALLKEKSVIVQKRKDRVTYGAYNFGP